MARAAERNAATIYLRKWSESSDTYKTMRVALGRIVEALGSRAAVERFGWHELRYEDVRGIAARLTKKGTKKALEPATINKVLVALRGVLESAWRAGLMPDEEYRRIKIESVPGNTEVAGRALSVEELDAIAAALPKIEALDAAVLAVLAGAGFRRIEVINLGVDDYANGTLIARGKRNKKRSIPLEFRWRLALEAWQQTRQPGEPMFDLGGDDPRRQISYIVERFCEKHGLRRFTPHDLRRTFGTQICTIADISIAKDMMGHSNIQTTTIYDRRGDEAKTKAIHGLHQETICRRVRARDWDTSLLLWITASSGMLARGWPHDREALLQLLLGGSIEGEIVVIPSRLKASMRAEALGGNESDGHVQLKLLGCGWLESRGASDVVFEEPLAHGIADVWSPSLRVTIECGDLEAIRIRHGLVHGQYKEFVVLPYGMKIQDDQIAVVFTKH